MADQDKQQILKIQGALNPRAAKVNDPLFRGNPFFDANDLVQVKYEMVRQVTHNGKSISEATKQFGLSRPSFYQAQATIEREGLLGLVPKKSGPRTRHKLTPEILAFIKAQRAADASLTSTGLAAEVARKFSVSVHPRSIERAQIGQKKTPVRSQT